MIAIILYFLGITLSASLFALEEFCEWREGQIKYAAWDIREHWVSMPQRASLFVLGLTYPFSIYEGLFLLGVYWSLTDGIMNRLKGRKFFAVSNESGNPLEKLNLVKFGFLIAGILIIIIKEFWR